MPSMRGIVITAIVALAGAARSDAQALPSSPGEAAFGTISEVVRLLKADSSTDWSKVDVEALRQHLIDMDDVMTHAAVVTRDIPGGAEFRVTGTGRTAAAIKRMSLDHFRVLDGQEGYRASATAVRDGALVTVTAAAPADAKTVAQIRGLGFAGLLAEANHHPMHHLALARGEAMMHSP